jgi:hypothetical protein
VGRAATVTTAAIAAVLLGGVAAAPPRAEEAVAPSWGSGRPVVAGAFHVHTSRSDGRGSLDDVATAARRAGLDFVVTTDHGDGTRTPEQPAYRSDVLVIDGVEVSTYGGHYAAIGMTPSPYPLAGEAADVVEDMARLGGFGVAAHGDSPKPELRWTDRAAGVDALEWMNLESVWRQATSVQIARAVMSYWFRQPETLTLAMVRPHEMFDWWDQAARTRRLVALAATDAHGSLASSYEACFRTMTTRVELEAPLRGVPAEDASAIVAALRAGHHFTVVDGVARPAGFEFVARRAGSEARPGDVLDAGGPITFETRVAAPSGTTLVLLRDGVVVQQTQAAELIHRADGQRGSYRVEARLSAGDQSTVPFIVSNPIFVGLPQPAAPSVSAAPAVTVDAIAAASPTFVWHDEHDPSSTAAHVAPSPASPVLTLKFALGNGRPSNQFAAVVLPVPADFASYDRLTLRAHASVPLRLSVQFREFGNQNPPRWRRSVYLDRTPRMATLLFDDLVPVPPNTTRPAPREKVGGLLLLVDTTNTQPGTAGVVTVSQLALERSLP